MRARESLVWSLAVGVLPTSTGVAAIVLTCVSGAQADVVMETVTVGNPGNANDMDWGGRGGVDYVYNIGKYEVTAGQYRDFLNAVAASDPYELYDSIMDSSVYGSQITRNGSDGNYTYDFSGRPSGTEAAWVHRPVNYVSWGDAARFSNWMHNGQGSGDTETGSYFLNGAMTNPELLAITREADATWVIPTQDEWYKSAYHKNDGVTGNYFDYPTSSNTDPGYVNDSGNLSGTGTPFTEGGTDPGNYATCDGDGGIDGIGSPYYRTEVGEWENSNSPYGTFDQGGNVKEWNETGIDLYRGLSGGSFHDEVDLLHRRWSSWAYPNLEYSGFGFRVAEVPEPAALTLLVFGGVLAIRRRR